ncbi:MAG: hypothetical protein K8F59_14050 [Rhodobacteraceae bacterium]|nr:hypothetical protein [Paracoccaceae bacterium]
MKRKIWLLGLVTVSLAACEQYDGGNNDLSGQFINKLPEGVLEIAATNQNLEAVQIDPSSGCYIYRYAGPVETTFLPLRTVSGAPICTRKQ